MHVKLGELKKKLNSDRFKKSTYNFFYFLDLMVMIVSISSEKFEFYEHVYLDVEILAPT